jgi:16S rRNA (adenine1518-N6/adenine1519-N6)-dimethyltransferase
MTTVRPKKHLGQHFLTDLSIAKKIVDSLSYHRDYKNLIEIGPGTGVLTDFLINKGDRSFSVIEIDIEAISFLKNKYPGLPIVEGDFLRFDLKTLIPDNYGIIGNFPYNISSQIFFKVLEDKDRVMEVVCMLQREVAQRIASPPGNKDYGILSVLLQAYYKIEYLFTVDETVFNPPPKVKSGVIRLTRNDKEKLDCDEKLFFRVVKQGFNNRRKTLRNALKPLNLKPEVVAEKLLDKRAEQLSVEDFVYLTKKIEGEQ